MSETKAELPEVPKGFRWMKREERFTEDAVGINLNGPRCKPDDSLIGRPLSLVNPHKDGSGWALPIEDAPPAQDTLVIDISRHRLYDLPAPVLDWLDGKTFAEAAEMIQAMAKGEDKPSAQAEPPTWMGYCRCCESGWPPTARQNCCPKCGAGPLARLPGGEYAISVTIYPPEGTQAGALTPTAILERLDAIEEHRYYDAFEAWIMFSALRSELRAQIGEEKP